MGKYIIAHDMGTSSDKAVLVDFEGKIVATNTAPYPTGILGGGLQVDARRR